jgi:tRNA (cmo5U34)-methyltransferase
MTPDFAWRPEGYLDRIRHEVPGYDELQERAIEAIPLAPSRVLELGFGTAETTRRIWERFPEARITGLDSSPGMVFRARELGWEEMRLGRIEDPLPDGPWDLVIAVLTLHSLDHAGKRDLLRRVRAHSRALVIGDLVTAPGGEAGVPRDGAHLASAAELAAWCEGEVAWEGPGVAVVRALYEEGAET